MYVALTFIPDSFWEHRRTTQDCFQTLTPISPQVAQIVTIAIRGPTSLELQLANHHALSAEQKRGAASASAAPRIRG